MIKSVSGFNESYSLRIFTGILHYTQEYFCWPLKICERTIQNISVCVTVRAGCQFSGQSWWVAVSLLLNGVM